ncbi:MAG: hypothetical protein IT375_17270 [Polyangiaceae bacterium]|nr:hypothetical protein [Polyangiaceae bacterium]
MRHWVCFAAAAALLVGCGDSSDDGGSVGGTGAVSAGGQGGAAGWPSGGSAGVGGGAGAAGSAGATGGAAGNGGSSTGGSGGSSSGGSGGSGTGGSGGSSSGGSGGCPTNGPPPGPAVKRFDVATLNCGSSGACTGSEDKCFCPPDFDALNVSPAHFMGVASDAHKAKIWGAGNFQAAYVDDLNTNWQAGGAARAAAIIQSAQAGFPCGVPEYFILNEISAGQWPDNASYRQFVIDVAKALKNTHGKTPIVASPFPNPGSNDASWAELAKYALIGAEVYLSGKEINANGNSVAWCQAQYQAAITAYANRGVTKDRLYLFEHFANTDASVGWGRAGVSEAGWTNAISARSKAIKNLSFAGFISYGWAGNAMHVPEAQRLGFMKLYTQQALP